MPTATLSRVLSAGGMSVGQSVSRTAESLKQWSVPLPAGKAGTLSTRTSDTAGTATLATGHGVATGATVDIYWTGGRRYGATAGTVSGTSVPFSGGDGDNLPSASSAIVVTPVVTIAAEIDGDAISMLGIWLELPTGDAAKGHVTFRDSTPAAVANIDQTARTVAAYDVAGGESNPFAGNPIRTLLASNGSSANAGVLTIIDLEEA